MNKNTDKQEIAAQTLNQKGVFLANLQQLKYRLKHNHPKHSTTVKSQREEQREKT
jgi:hypothetical protein